MNRADESGFNPARSLAPGRLLDRVSIEATPKQILGGEDSLSLVPDGAPVYVPHLPGRPLAESVAACRSIVAQGLEPTPHLPARTVKHAAELADILAQFADAGAKRLLLIAGDGSKPAGAFSSTLDVLDTGLLEASGIKSIGFAGHPQGHPVVEVDVLDRAIGAKAEWAAKTGAEIWLVTQFLFDADPFIQWDARLRSLGVALPVYAGVPGPAKVRSLLSFAMACGVSASARMLRARPGAMRLAGRWTPDALVDDLERFYVEQTDRLLAGVHFYPFGGLAVTAEWLRRAQTARAEQMAEHAAPPLV